MDADQIKNRQYRDSLGIGRWPEDRNSYQVMVTKLTQDQTTAGLLTTVDAYEVGTGCEIRFATWTPDQYKVGETVVLRGFRRVAPLFEDAGADSVRVLYLTGMGRKR